MANKKISAFDTITTIPGGPIALEGVLGVAGYCDDPASPGTDVNVSFSGADILAEAAQGLDSVLSIDDTAINKEIIISDGGLNEMTLGIDSITRNNAGNFTWVGGGEQHVNNKSTSAIDAIRLQTSNNAISDSSILIDSRSPGAGKLKLKTETDIQVDLPVAPTPGQVLSAKNISGDIEWSDAGADQNELGLLALYDAADFDDVLKTWNDSSGNSFGTATAQPGATTDPVLNIVGLGQPYLECDDSHMRVDRTGSEWTQFSYTQEVWINFTSNNLYNGVVDFSPFEEYAMYYNLTAGNNEIEMSTDGMDVFPVSGGAEIGATPTGWKHCVITFTGQTLTIYINGEPSVTSTSDGSVGIGPGENTYLDLLCSASGGTEFGFTGNCAMIALYERALNATEVKQRFNTNKTRFGL